MSTRVFRWNKRPVHLLFGEQQTALCIRGIVGGGPGLYYVEYGALSAFFFLFFSFLFFSFLFFFFEQNSELRYV